MKHKKFTRFLSGALAICMAGVMAISPAFAATVEDATIDTSAKASLTLYKYDWTNATKDGVWSADSYASTGQYDVNVNTILGNAKRQGDTDTTSDLGNKETSNGYAIKGVEYTYLKVADIVQFTEAEKNGTTYDYVSVLYKMDSSAAGLLEAIGLTEVNGSYKDYYYTDKNEETNTTYYYYESDTLIDALAEAQEANPTTVKNALEAYVTGNGGTAMALTDADGKTEATDLDLGLYLLVETKVPEMVTETTDPFFISLPMTNVDGGGNDSKINNGTSDTENTTHITDGGHEWLYDVTVYPKNNTGIVTLEKTVRESKADTGKNNALTPDTDTDTNLAIKDGYAHTATASDGDIVEYQIISTLPTITSEATYLAEYTFQDVLAAGLSYATNNINGETGDVVIEWFEDANCTKKVATWTETTKDAYGSAYFTVTKVANDDGSHTMTIRMTDAGLSAINTANTSANNVNGNVYAGYSNYTIRISYNAVVDSDASMVYGDAGNCNEVVLTWRRSSNSYYDTLIDDCHVYTYGIELTKVFSDGETDQEYFDEVLFKVYNETDNYYVVAELNETEGIWYVTDHVDVVVDSSIEVGTTAYTEAFEAAKKAAEAQATSFHPVDWNGKDGQIVIKGLEDDVYTLTEIETANGYTLLKDDIEIQIVATDDASRACQIYSKDTIGLIQNDSRFSFDGGLDLSLSNIPQAATAHNYLTGSATVDSNAVTMLNDEADTESTNALVPLSVTNTNGFTLPQTGENSAKWMPIVGASVIAAACCVMLFVVFLPKMRKQEEEK